MRIVVVDDEKIICEGTVKILRETEPAADVRGFTDPRKALAFLEEEPCDAVFLDVRMPHVDGVTMARRIKAMQPRCNIVFVTAYGQYQTDAWEMHASGYVMKPLTRERAAAELQALRFLPVREEPFHIRAFGSFEVFWQGRPLHFQYSKTRELLAYLVDRNGALVSNRELTEVLWGEGAARVNYFKRLRQDLLSTLDSIGRGDAVERQRGALAVVPGAVSCDLFDWNEGKPAGLNAFRGEYMSQYPWAADSLARLLDGGRAEP